MSAALEVRRWTSCPRLLEHRVQLAGPDSPDQGFDDLRQLLFRQVRSRSPKSWVTCPASMSLRRYIELHAEAQRRIVELV